MSGLRLVDDTAYDATSWNDVVGLAPSKNAVRDRFEAISGLVTVADEAADTTSFPLFATQATGSLLAIKSNAGLTFNAATGLLGATGLTVGGAATINGLDVGQKGAASVRIADASGMASLSSGGSFVAVGHGAGDATTTGSNWVAVGINSLEYSTAGSGSVALGAVAGSFHADGVTHLTATTDSVYLGKSSRGFDNTDSNTIVIGANAIGEGANKTTIGTSSTTDFHAYGTPKFGGTNSLTFSLASLTAARTLTAPDVSGTLTVLGNASTGSGSVVLATSPTLVTPTLGVATATRVGIGAAAVTSSALYLASTALAGTTQFGVFNDCTSSSGATSVSAANRSRISTAAAAYTCADVSTYEALATVLGSGSTITNNDVFKCAAQTIGATRISAFRGLNAAAAGRYNLYMDGTAQNHLAGNLGLGSGSTVPNATLSIGGGTTRATTQPTNAIDIYDGTAPVGALTNGCTLYVTSGEMRVMDAAGNATLLSPHDEAGNWIHDEINFKGRRLRIDMERLLKAVDNLLGGGFVEETLVEV